MLTLMREERYEELADRYMQPVKQVNKYKVLMRKNVHY